jgi:hypothetical protein
VNGIYLKKKRKINIGNLMKIKMFWRSLRNNGRKIKMPLRFMIECSDFKREKMLF